VDFLFLKGEEYGYCFKLLAECVFLILSAEARGSIMAAQATMAAQALALKASPIALRKLKCITVDVTGTLIAYKGLLGDYYCMAAKAAGLPCPDYDRMHAGFKVAYTDMATKYPCFGNAVRMPNVDWWRTVVRNSFLEVFSTFLVCKFTDRLLMNILVQIIPD
jgi:hypothetical protein